MTLPKTRQYLAASSCPPDIRAELLATAAGWRDAMDRKEPSDEEIVVVLATKLMGWHEHKHVKDHHIYLALNDQEHLGKRMSSWNPFTSEADCAEVVDEMTRTGYPVTIASMRDMTAWLVTVYSKYHECIIVARADGKDRKRAIVLAAYTALLHSSGAGDRSEGRGVGE